MKKIALSGVLCAALLAGWAQAQRSIPAAAGGGRNLGALERDWSLICFELQLSGVQFDTLRARYQEAWNWRRQALEQMQEGLIDRQAMLQQMAQIQARLDQEGYLLLSAEQRAQLSQLQEARRADWEGFQVPGR